MQAFLEIFGPLAIVAIPIVLVSLIRQARHTPVNLSSRHSRRRR